MPVSLILVRCWTPGMPLQSRVKSAQFVSAPPRRKFVRVRHGGRLLCGTSHHKKVKPSGLGLWLDSLNGVAISTLKGHTVSVTALNTFANDDQSQMLISGSYDTNIKLWDLRSKNCVNTFKGHSMQVNCLQVSPDGKWISSGSQDGLVKVKRDLFLASMSYWFLAVGPHHFQDDHDV